MIPFTYKELRKAWLDAEAASRKTPRSNAHRLLLFYAVECGLKAAYIDHKGQIYTDPGILKDFSSIGHDLNNMMSALKIGKKHHLPRPQLADISVKPDQTRFTDGKPTIKRGCNVGEINQIWRYGGSIMHSGDCETEKCLEEIHAILKGMI